MNNNNPNQDVFSFNTGKRNGKYFPFASSNYSYVSLQIKITRSKYSSQIQERPGRLNSLSSVLIPPLKNMFNHEKHKQEHLWILGTERY